MTTIDKIRDMIQQAERLKGVYFWRPSPSSAARRSTEKRESRPKISWTDGKDTYTAEIIVRCTCSHTEAVTIYTRNEKKTNLTAIRNSLKRLEA